MTRDLTLVLSYLAGEKHNSDKYIHDRDVEWLRDCDGKIFIS